MAKKKKEKAQHNAYKKYNSHITKDAAYQNIVHKQKIISLLTTELQNVYLNTNVT